VMVDINTISLLLQLYRTARFHSKTAVCTMKTVTLTVHENEIAVFISFVAVHVHHNHFCPCSTRVYMDWHELQHPTRCTRYSGTDTFTVMSSHIDAYKFSFLPRTVTDWNALPASTRAKQSTDSFKKALHTFPDTPADRC